MNVTVEAMHQHVTALCAEHDITYSWCLRWSEPWGAIDIEEVCIPPIKSSVSYATAMHEIGHIRGRYQRSRHEMVRERWAWRWAERNALMWTPVMDRHARECLQCHVTGIAAKKTGAKGRP